MKSKKGILKAARIPGKKRLRGLEVKKAINGYLFISPFLIGFIVFLLVPLITSFQMSISNVGFGLDGFILESVGLANYRRAVFADAEFNRLLTEELVKIGTRVPFTVVLSFFSALILSQKFKFRGLARGILFLPVILSSGVIIGVETNNSLLNNMKGIMAEYSQIGQITDVLEELILGSMSRMGAVSVILDAVNGIYDVMMASGIQILIFLAGLQTVPKSMYEAAKIEGATAWESFWKITLPMVSSLILIAVIYSIVDTCIRTDSDLFTKIRTVMVGNMDYGFSSAMAWMYFMAVMLIVLVVGGLLSKVVFYDE